MPSYYKCVFLLCLAITTIARAEEPNIDPGQRLNQQLAIVTSLHLSDVPLDQALDTLGHQVGIKFAIDTKALDDLGLKPDAEVSISVQSVRLETLLEFLLDPLDLTWTTRGGMFVITSEEEALDEVVARVYPVPDLLGTPEEQEEHGADYESLIDTIISVVDADSWVENGGPEAEIRPFHQASSLVIAQTIQSHLKIEQLLADIRHVREQQGLPIATYVRSSNSGNTRTPPIRTYVQPSVATPLPRSYTE